METNNYDALFHLLTLCWTVRWIQLHLSLLDVIHKERSLGILSLNTDYTHKVMTTKIKLLSPNGHTRMSISSTRYYYVYPFNKKTYWKWSQRTNRNKNPNFIQRRAQQTKLKTWGGRAYYTHRHSLFDRLKMSF